MRLLASPVASARCALHASLQQRVWLHACACAEVERLLHDLVRLRPQLSGQVALNRSQASGLVMLPTRGQPLQACKLDVKDTVTAEPSEALAPAQLVTLQVKRLRPKGTDEVRFETEDLTGMMQYLQGLQGHVPGAKPRRWPATVNHEFYLVRESTILSCKVRWSRGCVRSLAQVMCAAGTAYALQTSLGLYATLHRSRGRILASECSLTAAARLCTQQVQEQVTHDARSCTPMGAQLATYSVRCECRCWQSQRMVIPIACALSSRQTLASRSSLRSPS